MKQKPETKQAKATKAERVRALLREGKTIAEVTSLTGVTRQYVYSLRYHDKKKLKPVFPAKRGRGRPKGSVKKVQVVSIKTEEKDLEQYMRSLQTIQEARKPETFWQRMRYAFTGRF